MGFDVLFVHHVVLHMYLPREVKLRSCLNDNVAESDVDYVMYCWSLIYDFIIFIRFFPRSTVFQDIADLKLSH